jgi:hypothetical protein
MSPSLIIDINSFYLRREQCRQRIGVEEVVIVRLIYNFFFCQPPDLGKDLWIGSLTKVPRRQGSPEMAHHPADLGDFPHCPFEICHQQTQKMKTK